MKTITINGRQIGEGFPAYLVAEMSANHAGDIKNAKHIIHAAKEAGADCIKIQTYTPDTLTIDCSNEYFTIEDGLWKGETLYSLYSKAFTPWEWLTELKGTAESIGMDFFSTPFDNTAVDFLEDAGVSFYKIASFELVDIPLLEYVASKQKPIILSTGMASREEIEEAVRAVRAQGNDMLGLLKCSSAYPTVPDDMNLRTMRDMAETFDVPVGLSDHSVGSVAAITAVAMGACIVEKHFCLSRTIENPDSAFSMEPAEFADMVRDIRCAEKAMGKVSYDVSEQEKRNRRFRRSVFVVQDILKGEEFSEENVRCIRPGYGIMPKNYRTILGNRAKMDIRRGTPLVFDMIAEERHSNE